MATRPASPRTPGIAYRRRLRHESSARPDARPLHMSISGAMWTSHSWYASHPPAQFPELVKMADDVVVHADPPEEPFAEHHNGKGSSRRGRFITIVSTLGRAHWGMLRADVGDTQIQPFRDQGDGCGRLAPASAGESISKLTTTSAATPARGSPMRRLGRSVGSPNFTRLASSLGT